MMLLKQMLINMKQNVLPVRMKLMLPKAKKKKLRQQIKIRLQQLQTFQFLNMKYRLLKILETRLLRLKQRLR